MNETDVHVKEKNLFFSVKYFILLL